MKKMIVGIVLLCNCFVQGQKVSILDSESSFPVYNVLVHNQEKTKQVISDKNGVADLSVFQANELLILSHIGYQEFSALKSKLVTKRVIYLKSKTEQLEEVFLSASKDKESTKRIAEQVAVLAREEMIKLAPQSSADVLAEIPGIKVQRSQFGGGSPVLRGMEANRVLLVVDGVRMNNAIYRKGHLQNAITVSPNMIERTEVIFGPSSVIYGSDALGGVIHYYTKQPRTNNVTTVNTSLFSRFATVNNEKTLQAGIELQFKKLASYTSFSHSNFGDLIMGKNRKHNFDNWGLVTEYSNNTDTFFSEAPIVNSNPNLQRNTGYDQTDFLQKLFIPITDNTNLNFNFQYSTSSDIPRFDALTERRDGNLRFAEWYYGPQKRVLAASQLEINPDISWLQKGTITAAYQNIEESRINRRFASLDRVSRSEQVDVYSLNGDFFVPLTQENDRILSYGFEIAHNEVRSIPKGETLEVSGNSIIGVAANFPVQSRYADGGGSYTNMAAYINYRQDISDKSTLNTGIRFTDTYLRAKWIDDTFFTLPDSDIDLANSAFTTTLGYVYKPTRNWQINSVLSSGFRSPNLDDVGKVREQGGDVTVPNVSLRPEYVYNAELGLLRYFNNKRSFIGFTGYYTYLDNYIYREAYALNGQSQIVYDGELANVFANVNKNNAYIVGGTFSTKFTFNDELFAKGAITYTKGKSYDLSEPLSSIPPLFGNIALNYKRDRLETGVNLRFNGRKKIGDYNLSEGIDNIEQTPVINANGTTDADIYYGSPSWKTVNAFAKYHLTKHIDLQVNVENIFDEHYKEFASGVSAPGRNFSFSVFASF